jgi:hypothetical protein
MRSDVGDSILGASFGLMGGRQMINQRKQTVVYLGIGA